MVKAKVETPEPRQPPLVQPHLPPSPQLPTLQDVPPKGALPANVLVETLKTSAVTHRDTTSGELPESAPMGELAAMAPANESTLYRPTRAHHQIVRHFGVHITELLSGELIVPRILVYMCEYMLEVGGRRRDLFRARADATRVAEVRGRFEAGVFFDCGDPVVVAMLFRNWLRELPAPLFPVYTYRTVLHIVEQHMVFAKRKIEQHRYYPHLRQQTPEQAPGPLSELWDVLMDRERGETLANGAPSTAVSPLRRILFNFAFSVSASVDRLRELFFELPRVNRNALEYVGVFFAKLSLGAAHNHCTVHELATSFSSYLVRPDFWSRNVAERQRCQFLTNAFVVLFLYFIKKKHNILTPEEREMLERTDEEAINLLMVDALPSSSMLDIAVESAAGPAGGILGATQGLAGPLDGGAAGGDLASVGGVGALGPGERSGVGKRVVLDLDNVQTPSKRVVLNAWHDDAAGSSGAAGTSEGGRAAASSDAQRAAAAAQQAEAQKAVVVQAWDQGVDRVQFGDDAFLDHAPHFAKWLEQPTIGVHEMFRVERPLGSRPPAGGGADADGVLGAEDGTTPPGRGLTYMLINAEAKRRRRRATADERGAESARGAADGGADGPEAAEAGPSTPATAAGAGGTPASARRDWMHVNAINYDAGIAFPSAIVNHAAGARDDDDGVAEAGPLINEVTGKVAYSFDESSELLNSKTPWPHSGDSCESCAYKFISLFSSRARVNCSYCGRLLCAVCCNKQFIIPALLLEKGDFQLHTVCPDCRDHLSRHVNLPVLDYALLTESAVASFSRTSKSKVDRLRGDLLRTIDFLTEPGCASSEFLLGLIPDRYVPFLREPPRVSIADVMELRSGIYLEWLTSVEQLYRVHISQCAACARKWRRVRRRQRAARTARHTPGDGSDAPGAPGGLVPGGAF